MTLTACDWLALAREQAGRFWSKVDKRGDCWLWLAGTDKDGYGKFAITAPPGHQPKQKHVRAHRLAWEMAHGPMPGELVTRHHCDIPACVRPDHVIPGTQAANRLDCVARNRQPRAIPRPVAIEIIRRIDAGESPTLIAKDIGVKRATLYKIRSGDICRTIAREARGS